MKGNTTARSHSRGWHWKMWSLLLSSPSLPCSFIPQHSLSALTRSHPPLPTALLRRSAHSWVLEADASQCWKEQEQKSGKGRNRGTSSTVAGQERFPGEHTQGVPPPVTHIWEIKIQSWLKFVWKRALIKRKPMDQLAVTSCEFKIVFQKPAGYCSGQPGPSSPAWAKPGVEGLLRSFPPQSVHY